MFRHRFLCLMIALLTQAALASSSKEDCNKFLQTDQVRAQRAQIRSVLLNTKANGIFLSAQEMQILLGDFENQVRRGEAVFAHLIFLSFHYEIAKVNNRNFVFLC